MILHTTSENLFILIDKRLIENGKKSNTDHFVCHIVIHNLSKPNHHQNVSMIRAPWIYFVDLHSWSTMWALSLDWRMNVSVISRQGKFKFDFIWTWTWTCIWRVAVDGPRFSFFPLELEYQELARSEDKRVAYHVIVLYTEFIVWLGLI